MRRLLHLSDLHFGPKLDRRLVDSLLAAALDLRPHVIVISGDLTQRARRAQFAEAAEFIKRLPAPVLAVPGNHDLPLYDFSTRLIQPLKRYRDHIFKNPNPVYEDSEIIVVGANTATRWRWKEGRLRRSQIEAIASALQGTEPDVFRVLTMHHPPVEGLWKFERAIGCKPDLILSGHLHRSAVARHDSGVVLLSAGTATSTRLRGGCANAFNFVELESSGTARHARISTHTWTGAKFETESAGEYPLPRA